MTLIAIYQMPSFVSKAEAIAMSEPHGLKLECFSRHNNGVTVSFIAERQDQIDGLSGDLDYKPEEVQEHAS